MPITFVQIESGQAYSRPTLAALWGYSSFHAIARGVVTPKGQDKIVLFVTEEKQTSAEQYADQLSDDMLNWEGPTDHFAEGRMLSAAKSGEEIHLFHRVQHHSDFTYVGQLDLVDSKVKVGSPSQFRFRIKGA